MFLTKYKADLLKALRPELDKIRADVGDLGQLKASTIVNHSHFQMAKTVLNDKSQMIVLDTRKAPIRLDEEPARPVKRARKEGPLDLNQSDYTTEELSFHKLQEVVEYYEHIAQIMRFHIEEHRIGLTRLDTYLQMLQRQELAPYIRKDSSDTSKSDE
ncbi:hypothetical protein SAMD00019534_058460 [Acytostelium subglobosum LB1]|uniref:hypothetical protein n=1 Tax=Acytostelium subglobosum LB1 TaxID=1410327 RepID=UPI000644D280|nr:hypothetical protein SAMD00019534_058460 [Acytostelium subglobosum LB1]GAM22671.1 hypothetical protein SAMD00019534_058460 [Acytostelium subglobosum LB1]|eukprot:XP_012754791.1 hypothetical protein SAMD00019534_058460 [Acytostelium subglobosum LB1]